jgi:transcriptional regulator with XRE-family HTH domain
LTVLPTTYTDLSYPERQALRRRRMNLFLTQTEVADKMTERGFPGWHSPMTTSRVEQGDRRPSCAEVDALLDILGTDRAALGGAA